MSDHHHDQHHGHAYEHDHAGHYHAHGASGRALIVALGITLGFALVEAWGGWWTGSLALLGDASHMVSDAAALGLAAFAMWLAKRPVSARHSYGMVRAEVVAALLNCVFLLIVVGGIVVAAFGRWQNPPAIDSLTVIWIALVGMLVNIVVAWILSRGEQTMNVRGALLHVMGDLLGSAAALVSGIVIYFTGWTRIDPILSLVICLLLLVSLLRLLREVLNVIMEGVPLHIDIQRVGNTMAKEAGVVSVHDLHIWTLASGNVALSAHVVIADLQQWQGVLNRLRQSLHDEFGIDHVTLQPEHPPLTDTFIPVDQLLKTL